MQASAPAPLGAFERYLTVWVFLCIVAGISLGQVLAGLSQAVARMQIARVNLPVGLLIWVMIIPMLLKVDFGALHQVKKHWRGIAVTSFVNWAAKPFSMPLLGWLFLRHVFAPYPRPGRWTATSPASSIPTLLVHRAERAPDSYEPLVELRIRTTISITGTSIRTPTTVASVAPD